MVFFELQFYFIFIARIIPALTLGGFLGWLPFIFFFSFLALHFSQALWFATGLFHNVVAQASGQAFLQESWFLLVENGIRN